MQLNEQQQAVIDWGLTGTGSLNLIARAGCGKTSTIIELAKQISGRVFLGAFNKAIAEELKTRITKPNVTAGTMHSLGFQLWRQIANGRSEVDSRKVRGIIRRMNLYPFDKNAVNVTADAVGYAKQSGFGLNGMNYLDKQIWNKIFDHYDLWDEMPGSISPDRMLEGCIDVYQESLEMCQQKNPTIDYDDMILAPLVFGKVKPNLYDWVMIDEAQDTNEVRRRLAMWVLRPEGRLVAVGDPCQAIYGFAGANHDSMDLIKRDMNSAELPLSITYRCPKSIVALAQTWVPDILAHESAPEGTIREVKHTDFWNEDFKSSDVILCRNTRPLIGISKRLRKAGIPCIVEGMSGKALIALASRWGDDISIGEMETNLHAYVSEQVNKWLGKNRLDKVEAVEERRDILLDVASELSVEDTVSELIRHIEYLFSEDDDKRVLRLCTVHRAKGREWERVYLVGRNLYMPSKWAKKEWEIGQEKNLMYVAVTRVKSELVEVYCPPKKQREDLEWWEL